ncbi:MAG: hypothetical protein PVJ34_20580 [Anaerolineae bacterium]
MVLPALVPLARGGFFQSHDGIFHVYRLAALKQALGSGVLYPRWFPGFAFGYGHPVLNFYGPLSYYWGLPFVSLGLDAAWGTKMVLASGLIASALAIYLFARLHLARGPAVVSAVIYAYLPYHLIDLYVRGAVAEFLSFVWFPLLLLAFDRIVHEEKRARLFVWLALASILLVALVTTHSLSALIFAPVLAGYLALLWWQHRRLETVGRVALAGGLALALGAFYLLPVAAESRYVGLGHGASQGYQNHLLPLVDLLSWSPAYDYTLQAGVPITFPLGWVQALIFVAALSLPLLLRRRRLLALLFLAVGAFSILMLANVSLPLWELFENGLAFLQYPWRFHALAALVAAFLAGLLIEALSDRWPRLGLVAGALLCGVTAVWALWALPVTPIYPDLSVEGMWYQDRELGQIGATWTGEYVPIWVEEQRWAVSQPRPEDIEYRVPETYRRSDMDLVGVGYTRYELSLVAPEGASLALHQFYYPGWQAEWQGDVIAAYPEGELGLATFDLPPGRGDLVLRLALTPPQRWGTLISLIVALAVGVALVSRLQLESGSGEKAVVAATALSYLLLAAALLGGLLWPNGYVRPTEPVNANLADVVELQAYSAKGERFRAGDTVQVTLYWMALEALDRDYKTFLHLTDAEVTRQPTQHDDDPGGDFTPTTRWMPGELVPDSHTLTLPHDLPPGRYHIWADMYEYPSVTNLTVLSSDLPNDGKRVLLREIQVVAP